MRGVYDEWDESSSAIGAMGVRETSGVQVRLGSRERERERPRERGPEQERPPVQGRAAKRGRSRARDRGAERERPQGRGRAAERSREGGARRRAGRRSGLVAAGVLVLAGLVTIGLVLTRGSGDGGTGTGTENGSATAQRGPSGPLPRAGKAIEVGTADGSKYRIATVTSGVNDGVTTFQSPPSGTSFAYVEYLLTNPTNQKVLLDFPGDVFVKRILVASNAQGRCMPQAGVPEDMCTPPTKSRVVRRLSGGELISGEGGDKYMPPGSTYLVRATVDVPVQREITRDDMGLYVWKQLYMADQLAKQAPFPS
ncbi:hypothetical protein [Actinomadura sp. 9N215]|uniref:hypothetical protein n=1 Tax=Actinomadura sp. 9N215 TaxID=3375150 RepID=UPI00378B169D